MIQSTKIKCAYNRCEHKTAVVGKEYHDEGLCWKITQEEFTEYPTNAKYCPCSKEPNLIRRYDRVGYMERGQYDHMITKPCVECGEDILVTIHKKTCVRCSSHAYL